MQTITVVVYDNVTGKITLTGILDPSKAQEFADSNAPAGNYIMINDPLYDITSYIVVNGALAPVPQSYLDEEQWKKIRSQRTQLLKNSDWVTIRAVDTGVAISADWLTYRQSLRDITLQSDPYNIVWPTEPVV